MRSYLTVFDPHIRGLVGTKVQLATVAAADRARYRRVPRDGGDDTMEHTSAVLLLDATGRFVKAVPFGADEGTMQARLESLLRTGACRPSEAGHAGDGRCSA